MSAEQTLRLADGCVRHIAAVHCRTVPWHSSATASSRLIGVVCRIIVSGLPSSKKAAACDSTSAMSCPPHKYGVKPYGQLYLEACPEIRTPGLGHLAVLSDELLVTLLYALPAAELQRLGMASKALYVFCHYDELWKALTLEVSRRRLMDRAAYGVVMEPAFAMV